MHIHVHAHTHTHTSIPLVRYMVSSMPYFTWLMLAVTIAALCGQISEIYIGVASLNQAMPTYLWWLDLIFVVFTLLELLLKVTSLAFSITSTCLLTLLLECCFSNLSNSATFMLFFCLFVFQIFANGFFFNPHAAIQSVWDVIDWVIVFSTLAVMVVYVVSCGCHYRTEVSTRNLPEWML